MTGIQQNLNMLMAQDCPVNLYEGDCAVVLKSLPSDSIDGLATDPPAGIGFLGHAWDGDRGGRDAWIAWFTEVMQEVYRVLKPGAHGVVWALPRTSHWTATGAENAGFEIRDRFSHHFGNGMAKSHSLHCDWEGWGTNLKPSTEDWWLIRKPMTLTTTENMNRYGVGALHIDAGRITVPGADSAGRFPTHTAFTHHVECAETCHPECPIGALERQSGDKCGSPVKAQAQYAYREAGRHVTAQVLEDNPTGYGDTGTASRFFPCFQWENADFLYTGRAATKEKNAGCTELSCGKNTHNTVKPLALMRYLIKLIAPVGATILDPFMGSGSTGVACTQLEYGFVGIEMEPNYLNISRARIDHARREKHAN